MLRATAVASLVVSVVACTAAPTLRTAGSPVPFVLVTPVNSPVTTTVTVTDRSGLVDGVMSVDPTTLGLSTGDWNKLNEDGYVVVGITGSNDIALLWGSGVCYPQQTVAISGAATHLNVDIQLIPPTIAVVCAAVGGGPSLRVAVAAPVDLMGVAITVTSMRPVQPATTSAAALASIEPAPACTASNLAIHGGRMGGGTGTAQGDVFLTNTGATPCTLSGAPIGIALLRSDGTVLPLVPQQPDPASLGPVVTLPPGQRDVASIAFNWSNWCGPKPGPLRVQLALPAGGTVIGPINDPAEGDFVPRCDQPSAPSAIEQLWGFATQAP